MALLYLSTERYPIKICQHHDIRIPRSWLRNQPPRANPSPLSHHCSTANDTHVAASVSTDASSPILSSSCHHNDANNGSSSSFYSSFIHRGTRSAISFAARHRYQQSTKQLLHIADCLLRPPIRRLYASAVPLERDIQGLVATE